MTQLKSQSTGCLLLMSQVASHYDHYRQIKTCIKLHTSVHLAACSQISRWSFFIPTTSITWPASCSNNQQTAIVSRWTWYYTVSQKKQAKLFLLQLRQTSTKSDNFWHNDGKLSNCLKLYEVHSFSTAPNSRQCTTVLNADVPNCYITL